MHCELLCLHEHDFALEPSPTFINMSMGLPLLRQFPRTECFTMQAILRTYCN